MQNRFVRRSVLAIAVLLLCGAAFGARAERPNIIFILVDDLGREWVSAYGADDVKTPNLDKLADTGMQFKTAYSMPQCTPTRVTLLTGQYPSRHGWVNHWDVPRWGAGCHFDPKHNLTFARVLRGAGYATAIAGKWQINDFRVQPDILKQHGFDEWCMWTGGEGGNPPSNERYWDPYVYTTHAKSRTYKGKFGPDMYNDFVLDFLKRNRDKPMMIYYPMTLTHTPLVHTPHEPDVKDNLSKHKAMVRYTDYLVGRVIQQLDDLGIRKRTIVFFSTDNGTTRGITGHLRGRAVKGGKATDTVRGVREPFLVNGPGMVPGGVAADALTDFTDLFPTFLELAGVEMPAGATVDGKSIAGVILGKDKLGPREWVMAMGHDPARMDDKGVRPLVDYAARQIRDKEYKIVVGEDRRVRALYNMEADPWEDHNLIGSNKPADIAALKRLTAVIGAFPETDGRPRYDPLPPQPWDVTYDKNGKMIRK